MIKQFLSFLCVFLAATGLSFAQTTFTSESLFNRADADKLSRDQQGLFGPKSSKYRYDKRMIRAAEIAAARARAHSTSRCWRYVKTALLAANVVETYPKTAYAKEAGHELQMNHGFKRIRISDPYDAPIGSILVYGGRGAGHVEIRTPGGFVSDFNSEKPSKRPLIGVFVKPKA